MNHLIFSLQATMPVFFLIVLGYVFKQTGLFTQSFVKGMNRFVFVVALPVLLFKDLATENFVEAWDGKYILFCLIVTLLSIAIAYGFSLVISSRKMRGEFIQAAYRSSAAILGIAFIQNIYGSSGAAPFMIIATVPLYNIMAVIVLNASAARQNEGQAKEIVKGILTNPIIIGIGVGLLWSLFSLPYPVILSKTVDSVSALASPMGLMALGGSVTTASVYKVWKPAVLATFLKLIGFVMLFLPLAVFLGFSGSQLVAILIMLGSATTVSSFVMAKNSGHAGELTAAVVLLTTLLSSLTLTFWLFILSALSLI